MIPPQPLPPTPLPYLRYGFERNRIKASSKTDKCKLDHASEAQTMAHFLLDIVYRLDNQRQTMFLAWG